MGSVGQVPKAAQGLGQPPTVSKAANTSAVSLPATSPLCMQPVPLAGQLAHYNACRSSNCPSLTGPVVVPVSSTERQVLANSG